MKVPNTYITVIAKISKFSNEAVHLPDKECKTEYSGFELGLREDYQHYEIEVHANAKGKQNFGSVDVKIREYVFTKFHLFEGTLFISVRDASGNQRFPRSFTKLDESKSVTQKSKEYRLTNKWRKINYIKRDTLLRDPQELLPNDTLTLQIEIHGKKINRIDRLFLKDVQSVIYSSLKAEESTSGIYEHYLLLDSPLVNILSRESSFFQRLLDTPMLEGSTRRMNISEFEYNAFKGIAEVLLCDTYLIIYYIGNIFEMYYVADKYDIAVVTETCINFLKLCLSDHSLDELWQHANSHPEDKTLTASLQNLISQVCNEVTEYNKDNFPPERRVGSSDWIYKSKQYHPEYGTDGLLFENPYKTDLYFYK